MKREKEIINTYTLMSTLIKKKEKRNSPVKSGNPAELKEEALMPGLLLLCQLTMRHQESQERSETAGNKVGFFFLNQPGRGDVTQRRRDVEAAERLGDGEIGGKK